MLVKEKQWDQVVILTDSNSVLKCLNNLGLKSELRPSIKNF